MTQVHPHPTAAADRCPRPSPQASRTTHPSWPTTPKRSPVRCPYRPAIRGLASSSRVAQRLVQLLLLGPQVLPRGLPGHAGDAQRDPGRPPRSTPTSSPWSGASSSIADVAADYVNCTQCGACELRCPNTLFTGDFYRFRTRTVDVVKAVRALAVEHGIHQPDWQRWNERTDERTHEPVLGDVPISQEPRRATGPTGWTSRSAARPCCSSTARPPSTARRCRGRSRRCCSRPAYEFGLMGEQWCCGGPAAEMGYVDQARAFAEHNLDDWRAIGTKRVLVLDPHDYITFTEDYPEYFGDDFDIEIVLVDRAVRRPDRDGQADARRPGRTRASPTTTRAG